MLRRTSRRISIGSLPVMVIRIDVTSIGVEPATAVVPSEATLTIVRSSMLVPQVST